MQLIFRLSSSNLFVEHQIGFLFSRFVAAVAAIICHFTLFSLLHFNSRLVSKAKVRCTRHIFFSLIFIYILFLDVSSSKQQQFAV
jgi:hypothetical protein